MCPGAVLHAVECVSATANLHVWADHSEDEAPESTCRPRLLQVPARRGLPANKWSLLGLKSRLPWGNRQFQRARTARWLQVLGFAAIGAGKEPEGGC